MIYCVNPNTYPTKGKYIEESSHVDLNDFEWRIARVENGFFVKFFGDSYFSDNTFRIRTLDKEFMIKNTNCIWVQNPNFGTYCDFRDMIRDEYTDDIWEGIADLLSERFQHDKRILKTEIF